MIDPFQIGLVTFLLLIILYLLFERATIITQSQEEKNKLLEELSRTVKALISKNANDYVMTTSIDKVPTEEKAEEVDEEVPLDMVDDDAFDKALGIKRKTVEK